MVFQFLVAFSHDGIMCTIDGTCWHWQHCT